MFIPKHFQHGKDWLSVSKPVTNIYFFKMHPYFKEERKIKLYMWFSVSRPDQSWVSHLRQSRIGAETLIPSVKV